MLRPRSLLAALLLAGLGPLSSCGDEEVACIIAYDTCDGAANPCEPLCVFEDEAPSCGDLECNSPNDPPGSCELFATECAWR